MKTVRETIEQVTKEATGMWPAAGWDYSKVGGSWLQVRFLGHPFTESCATAADLYENAEELAKRVVYEVRREFFGLGVHGAEDPAPFGVELSLIPHAEVICW